MSNSAAAALGFPVGLGVAASLKLDPPALRDGGVVRRQLQLPHALWLADEPDGDVPGRCTLGDFARAGLPVALVFIAVARVAMCVVFSFRRL